MRSSILWLFACSLTATAATPLSIVTRQIPDGLVGTPYSFQLQATGGTPPYLWWPWSGHGIQIDSTGLVHGTATEGFTLSALRVDDSAGQFVIDPGLSITCWDRVRLNFTALPIATLGLSYSEYNVFTYAKAITVTSGALPPGIAIVPGATLQGEPTKAGVFAFTLTATGYGGDTLTQAFTVTVVAPAIGIGLQPAFSLTAGQPASIPWVINGGIWPFSVTVTGQPDGMTLAPNSLSLAGTPTRAGTFNVIVLVVDGASTTQQASTIVTVFAPLAVGSGIAAARNNNSYSASLSATGGLPPYLWGSNGRALPSGLSLSAAGQITGLVTAAPGIYPLTVTVTDARYSTASGTLSLVVAGPTIGTQSMPHAQVGMSYSQTLQSTGGTPPFVWSVSSGALPPGLALGPATGIISGLPTALGAYPFIAQVADNYGSLFAVSLSIVVDAAHFSLSDQTLSTGNVGSPYQSSVSLAGGVAPYQFTLDSGTLPDGITLSQAGILSGAPTRKGVWTFIVRATDGSQQTAKANVTIQMLGPIPQLSNGSQVNAASFLSGLAPGEYFTIFGKNLATSNEAAQTLPLPANLGNVIVQWNGAPLPLLAVSPVQINAQVPFEATLGAAELKVTSDGVTSAAVSAKVQAAGPGLFQISAGFLLAINEDGTLNSSSQPAPAGSVVMFYATGCGPYDKPLTTGQSVPIDRLYPLALPHTLTVGGVAAEILFAGAAPALGSGLVQVNAQIPAMAPGEWPVQLSVAGVSSNDPHIFISNAVK
jgi:large repetitive protein